MQFVLLLLFESLEVADACSLGGVFYLLLLQQDEFVPLFCLAGKILPEHWFFFVVFFDLTFKLKDLLFELWTVLALIAAFWKQKLLAEKLEGKIFILTIDFVYILLQGHFPLKYFIHLDLKSLDWAVILRMLRRILRQRSRSIFNLELFSQVFNLSPQLADNLSVIFDMEIDVQHVSLYYCFYLFRSVSVFQSVPCVFKATPSWANVRYHDSATVTAEAVFQKSR